MTKHSTQHPVCKQPSSGEPTFIPLQNRQNYSFVYFNFQFQAGNDEIHDSELNNRKQSLKSISS